MKTYYILGADKLEGKYPSPKDFDLIEVQADTIDEAMKLASNKSNKRYFCSLRLQSLVRENQR